jgi:hypothetical protein
MSNIKIYFDQNFFSKRQILLKKMWNLKLFSKLNRNWRKTWSWIPIPEAAKPRSLAEMRNGDFSEEASDHKRNESGKKWRDTRPWEIRFWGRCQIRQSKRTFSMSEKSHFIWKKICTSFFRAAFLFTVQETGCDYLNQ